MNNNWQILQKELNYYNIKFLGKRKCQFYNDSGKLVNVPIVSLIKRIDKQLKQQKDTLLHLCKNVIELLKNNNGIECSLLDQKLTNLFIFSLKDLAKFLLCFEEFDNSELFQIIEFSLNKDITDFSKEQISKLPDCKIAIDWTYRVSLRLTYIKKMLYVLKKGPEKTSANDIIIKIAIGVSGPWANLDLPMEERVWDEKASDLKGIEKDKKHQRRYELGFRNYNNTPGVGEGFKWREIRNEPFLWSERLDNSPYPSRETLMRG